MELTSGLTTQYVPFVAVDATDLKTRKTGLSSFTVYRSRNGGTLTAYTTPTIVELSSANAPGVYALLVDEDTTITSGANEESYFLQISQASMAPVSLNCVLKRPIVTAGQTLTVASGIASANVTQFGGTNGTFSGGRPEVNTTHAAGTAWNSASISSSTFANNAITSAVMSNAARDSISANVWAASGRTLTAGTNIVLAKGTGITGFNDLSATQVNAAVLDETDGIETGLTPRQAWRVIAAACAGKASGLATTTAVYRNAQADSKDRITATVDSDGNRTAVTLDLT